MSPAPESLMPVLQALSSALSPSSATRQESLSLLSSWTTLPGYYSSLVEIFCNRDLDLGNDRQRAVIRMQAVLQFKNGTDKYWRRGAVNAIAVEEKHAIRPRLLAMVNEPDRLLAKNVALCIGKIARLDYGMDWDDLPSTLLSSLSLGLSQSPSPQGLLITSRTLLFLHSVVKSLSSNRMPKGRALMSQLAGLCFGPLREIWERMLSLACGKMEVEGFGVGADEIECALLAWKSLSKLLVYGYKDASADEEARVFFTSSVARLSSILSLRLSLLSSTSTAINSNGNTASSLTFLTRLIISHGKLYRLLFSHSPKVFLAMNLSAELMNTYYGLVTSACSADATSTEDIIASDLASPYPTALVVQSLLLLKQCLGDWASSSSIPVDPAFVKQFAEILVTRLLPLRPEDLQQWDEEPEEFMCEEESERWEFELRPCAEHVLKAMLNQYKEDLGPLMASMLQQASSPQSMEGLLLKEGVYCAFGRSPSDLDGAVNFEQWLEGTLVPEAAGTDSSYRIIRRRIAWLLGSWIGEDLPAHVRTRIYSTLIHLISRNNSTDTAIRLTAARSLAKCDTWDFDKEAFVPFLGSAVEETVQLLGEVTLSESMMRLNQTLGVIIDRVGGHIAPYAGRLAEILGTLWSSAQENHFQTSVLVTLTKLAEALDDHSQALHPQACPIIQLSVDPTRPSHVYLQEDGLELWSVLLKRSSALSPEMLSLLPQLVALLAAGTDVLPHCLRILESYLLLDAVTVMQLCAVDLFTAFEGLLGELKLEAVKVILHALNIAFQTSGIETWAGALDSSAAFVKLLTPLSRSETPVLVVTKYLCTVARIVMAGPDTFHQLVDAAAARTGISSEAVLAMLIDCWIERLDNMSQGGQRKLVALALAQLVATTRPTILERLPDLISVWSSAMAQTEETETGDAELYQLPDDYQSDGEVDYTEHLEQKRRQALSARDPVHAISLKTLIGSKLAEAQALTGGVEAFQATWLARVDPLVVEELVQRLDGRLAG